MAAVEGSLLVVDASQGVEAQTLANVYHALDANHEIVPVLNKVDLPAADVPRVKQQIEDVIGIDASDALEISAKSGLGIDTVLEAIVHRLPAPKGDINLPLKALLVDSWYDTYLGVVVLVRIIDGVMKKGQKIRMMASGDVYELDRVAVSTPKLVEVKELGDGELGVFTASIKEVADTNVGDTITEDKKPTAQALPDFRPAQPVVFCGLFPVDASDFDELRAAMGKLRLNDASFSYEMETSAALGFGFRCGFLGLLHMEIIQERLTREFDIDVITTVPNVNYKVHTTSGEIMDVYNPSDLPEPNHIDFIEEPYIHASIITKAEFIGPILTLCIEKRGILKNQTYLTSDRAEIVFEMPLGEIVFDFYDKLKSISKGYASFDYHPLDFKPSKLIRLEILLNGDPVDALSALTHFDNAYPLGRKMCEKLKELIPRQQFDIAIQAAIGSKIIARETVKAVRKDVTAKCYGGDISRKRKLLEKQKEGKKRMRQVGNVEVPQSAFLAVLKLD